MKKRIWKKIEPGILKAGQRFKVRISRTIDGQKTVTVRHADSLNKAKNLKRQLEHKSYKGEKLDADTITFAQLAQAFEKAHLREPVYTADRGEQCIEKLGGLKNWKDGVRAMKLFVAEFGTERITRIEPSDVRAWIEKRYATPKQRGNGQRTMRDVNRDLSFLRQAFNFAIEKGWLEKNPVRRGTIKTKKEHKRERAISKAEETLLLDAVTDPLTRSYLIFLLDTGIRVEESHRITRANIDLSIGKLGHIYLPAGITKTKERRDLPVLTERLREVIEDRFTEIPSDGNTLIFGKQRQFRSAFENACKRAQLENLQFRDCRHTFITRAVPAGIPLSEAMKVTGHKKVETFLRYLNTSEESHNANAERFQAYIESGMVHSEQIN